MRHAEPDPGKPVRLMSHFQPASAGFLLGQPSRKPTGLSPFEQTGLMPKKEKSYDFENRAHE